MTESKLIYIKAGRYSMGGGLALQLYERTEYAELEPYATLTVNLPEYGNRKNCAFVDTNNFPDAPKLISEYRLGKRTGNFGYSGYCAYPEYEFDLDALEKYCLNPEELKGDDKND